jgi:general secretion pathway protein N
MSAKAERPHWGRWLSVGLLLYAVFLFVALPASLLALQLTAATAGALRLSGVTGTVWHGNGVIESGANAQEAFAARLSWRFNPLWLLAGRIEYSLQADQDNASLSATLRAGYHRVALRDVNAEVPAKLAALVYPPAALFAPTGRLHLTTNSLDLGADGLEGRMEVLWSDAGGRMVPTTLGDYRLEVTGRGSVANLNLLTVRGPLELNGQGQWNVVGDGTLAIRGSAKLAPDAPSSFDLLVNMLGGNNMNLSTRISVAPWLGLPAH